MLRGVCVSLKKIKPPQYHQTNRTPVRTSTIGCKGKIGSLQCLHLPLSKMKESSGILSYQAMVLRHESHLDLPETQSSPLVDLRITTHKKLPMIAPKTNRSVVITKNDTVIITLLMLIHF